MTRPTDATMFRIIVPLGIVTYALLGWGLAADITIVTVVGVLGVGACIAIAVAGALGWYR